MNDTLTLDGAWQLAWSEFRGDVLDVPQTDWRLTAIVPGDVHLDLMRQGKMDDPFVGMNLDHALWVEQKDWWYRREFDSPPDLAGRRALLVFHGLDCFATVWLNGKIVGRSANMFRRYEFDVTAALVPAGSNELIVRLASVAHSVSIDPGHPGVGIWGPERLFCRKAQMSFGWDIAPRLVTVGIWRPVELVLVDQARITDFHVSLVRFDGADAFVRVDVEVEWLEGKPETAILAGSVHTTDWKADLGLRPGRNIASTELRVRDAPRWWPIGYGKPNLCDAGVELRVADRTRDARRLRTGLRAIELVREPQPSGAESFRFRCNGKDVFVTGFNWTPADAIFARVTSENITNRLEKLAGISCNMLRVWGGGIYEPAHFYAECSRLGILVWQDFMMACGWYPQTDAFAAELAAEAGQVVRDLRGEPCLAVWSGDNEVDGFYPKLASHNRLTRDTLAALCAKLDPATPYVPSSPWRPSGAACTWTSATEGDSHYYLHGRNYREPGMWDIRPRFMSEFGRLALPSTKLIRRYFPKGSEWPLTSRMWFYHGSDTTHVGCFRVADKILEELRACGKPEPANIREAVNASQELQAEGLSALIERYCSDPEFGGFLIWNVADCWPQQSDAVIDYEGVEKKVFRRLKRLFTRVRRVRQVGHSQKQERGLQ
jgi:beta-mannosidase